MRLAALALAMLGTAAAAAALPAGSIEVKVTGIVGRKGLINVAVCPRQTFRGVCPYVATTPARPGLVGLVVPNVPPGRYAVRVFHDTNANGRFDKAVFGIPEEGLGFSRRARRTLRRPKFEAAAFRHDAAAQSIVVTMRYIAG